jgi:hypothetical protein
MTNDASRHAAACQDPLVKKILVEFLASRRQHKFAQTLVMHDTFNETHARLAIGATMRPEGDVTRSRGIGQLQLIFDGLLCAPAPLCHE